MKNYLLVLFAFLLLAGCKEAKKNEVAPAAPATPTAPSADDENPQQFVPDRTVIYIRLIEEIGPDVTNINIYDYIQLYDNDGNESQSNKQSIENFTSPIYSGRRVKWKNSNKSMQKIHVKTIIRKNQSDPELLVPGNESGNNSEVERKVRTGQNDGAREHYAIEIRVKMPGDDDQNDKKWKTFKIDPVLEWHPQ